MSGSSLLDDTVDLAARHGIELDPSRLRFEEAGLDFRVAFARAADGTDWVLRIPRRRDLAPTIAAERRILDVVARHLPVAVPDWQVCSDALVAYPTLPGEPGLTLDADGAPVWHYDVESAEFARSLGALIAALHRVPVDDAVAGGVPERTPQGLREQFHADLDRVRSEFTVAAPLHDRFRRRLDDDGLWPDRTAVTHGELYPAHLLLAPDATVLSVLDWTTAQVGDPAVDFTYQQAIASPTSFDRTVEAYEAAGGARHPRLAERCAETMAASSVSYGIFALTTGDATHRAAAQAQLDPTA